MRRDPQLTLFAPPRANPNVRWLEDQLRSRPEWFTAAQLIELSGKRLHDRAIRELASASEWVISGQLGYKHLEHATPEEVHHATAWLESQARKMSDRAGAIRRNAHRRFG